MKCIEKYGGWCLCPVLVSCLLLFINLNLFLVPVQEISVLNTLQLVKRLRCLMSSHTITPCIYYFMYFSKSTSWLLVYTSCDITDVSVCLVCELYTPVFTIRTLTGCRQRSMCLSRPPIILSWSDYTRVFKPIAGEHYSRCII